MKLNKISLKIEHIWALTAIAGIFIFVNTHPIRPQDFWWHIAIGREIATTGKIPVIDNYSYTEVGQTYPSYQMFWLMETTLYDLYRLGGPALVVFFQSLVVTAAYGVVFWICKEATKSWRVGAFSVLFAAALGLNDWNVRPQGITFLLGSLFLLAIYQYRRSHHWYWLEFFPLGMLIWVNSHGTFVIGLVLIGLWWGQELWEAAIRRMRNNGVVNITAIVVPGLMFVITTLTCLINPRGIGIIDYVKTLSGNSVIQNLVTEWAPPSLSTMMGVLFYGGLLGTCVILAVSPKRPDFFQLATLVIFGLLGIKTSRGVVWFGLVMAPVVADHVSAIANSFKKNNQKTADQGGSRQLNVIFTIVILAMAVVSLPWLKSYLPLPTAKAGLVSAETPLLATQVLLDQNPPGKLFNSMSFGSYLIWAAYPRYQVFVDTRIELYSEKIWMDYLNISNAIGDWETTLKNYGVNTLMLSPEEQSLLISNVSLSNSWKQLYKDEAAVIFIRIR